jgi:ubiquinone/menaquinone biosynthesis C-methylase UbiE
MQLKEEILRHYKAEALKHGLEGTCTIQDMRTRQLEMDALFAYIHDGLRILEIGCGNGYLAQALIERFAVQLDATDLSRDLIGLAKERHSKNARGLVSFTQADVLELNAVELYDLIFTERCLQNLVSWEEQRSALANITRAIKPGGYFVMLESFLTGKNCLNAARRELDLPDVETPWHNVWFDEEATKAYLESLGCIYVDQNRFLSGYYFGSRVLLPALLPKHKKVTSQSSLNDYFCGLPPHGDFCPMKILRFRKKTNQLSN